MKYDVILLTMVRDEDHIIQEWIQHYQELGVNHIFIYDDRSKIPVTNWIRSPNVTVYTIDVDFYDTETFTIHPLYDPHLYSLLKENKQLYFYNYFLKSHHDLSKWLLCFDIDEFLIMKDNNSLPLFLKQYDSYDRLYIPWLMFGSSFYTDMPKGFITNNFIYHENHYHEFGKSIFKPSCYKYIKTVHHIIDNNEHTDNAYIFDFQEKLFTLPIHINHYIILSAKKYLQRKLRSNIGQANGKYRSFHYYLEMVHSYNNLNLNTGNEFCDLYELTFDKQSSFELLVNRKLTIDDLHRIIQSHQLDYKIVSIDILKKNNIIPQDFSFQEYKLLNPDLINLSNQSLLMHFLIYFPNEKRSYKLHLPDDFNPSLYRSFYPDLEHLNDVEISNHYFLHGKDEQRIYKITLPDDFNVANYISKNPDINHLTESQASLHYFLHGRYENRNYS